MNPSDSRLRSRRFRFLIRRDRWFSPPPQTGRKPRAVNLREHADPATPGVDECHFRYSSTLPRPSPSDHRVGFSGSFTRLLIGSLALRPALLLLGNSRPRVTATPLPHATGAYGQLPGRDFNPLDSLLLLRTARLGYFHTASSPCPALCLVTLSSNRGRPLGLASRRCPDMRSILA